MQRSPYLFSIGFHIDAKTLIDKFAAIGEPSIANFGSVWKQMYFPSIFLGRATVAELYEICDDFIHIAKYFLVHGKDVVTRIGGIFLTYGLYIHLPNGAPAKLMLTLEEWKSVQGLWEFLQEFKMDEPLVILTKLIRNQFVNYSVVDRDRGLEKCFVKNNKDPSVAELMYLLDMQNITINKNEEAEQIINILLNEMVPTVRALYARYRGVVTQLNLPMLHCPLESLFDDLEIIETSISGNKVHRVHSVLTDIATELKSKVLGDQNETISEDDLLNDPFGVQSNNQLTECDVGADPQEIF